MIISVLLVLLGFVLLIKGADWMISGASVLAKKNNISDMVIGLTIVAFGTSAPELVVSSVASVQGHSGIILGNVIGSNIFNLFLILGIVGVVSPINVQSATVWKEIPISLLAVLLVLLLGNTFLGQAHSYFSLIDGLILLGFFLLFLVYIYRSMKSETIVSEVQPMQISNLKIVMFIVVGLAGLVIGGRLVVDNAVSIAKQIGISEKIIGLTIIAAGTSLPELVTSVVAALKGKTDMAIGNIIGSNIFNVFLILGVSVIINPFEFNTAFNFDILVLLGGTLFLFVAMFTGKRKKLDRWEAVLLLLAFVAYTIFMLFN